MQIKDIIPYGEKAILIRWPDRMDRGILEEIWACEQYLADRMEQIQSIIAGMNSLTVIFIGNPPPLREISDHLNALTKDHGTKAIPESAHHLIPVCYDPQLAPDQAEVYARLKVSREELIDIHLSQTYLNVMTGFLPGFPYLHGVSPSIQLPRKSTPSIQVPAGSVAISNQFTCIYPQASPGGWHVIGRTPQRIFDLARGASPCLILRNDTVSFYPISLEEFRVRMD